VLGALILGIIALIATKGLAIESTSFAYIPPRIIVPHFNVATILTVSIPLAALIIGAENAQAIGVLYTQGYKPPINAMTVISGFGGIAAGLVGAHNANIAGPMTAICSSEEAGENKEGRYAAGIINGIFFGLFGIFASFAIAFVKIIPSQLINVLAGLAMINVLINSFRDGFQTGKCKMGAFTALVIGASGFIGANLLRLLLRERNDACGTFFSGRPWRLADVPAEAVRFCNLQDPISMGDLFRRTAPKVIFDCSSFGAYSFERDAERIHATNYLCFIRMLEEASRLSLHAYIHAGSSSEYGVNAAAPAEDSPLVPNSHYAVSKVAAAAAIAYFGKCRGLPVANLRLYSVYGPWEDSSRLIPTLCEHGLRKELPPFAGPDVSRDFVHTDDAVAAFAAAALRMSPEVAGESFNIGTGRRTTLAELAALAAAIFDIRAEPQYSRTQARAWDVNDWRANPDKAARLLGWTPRVPLEEGLRNVAAWWREQLLRADFHSMTKKTAAGSRRNSLSVVIACYRDNQAIPVMHERLTVVLKRLGLEYEIIFVNDGSPDDSEERIRAISATDPHVIGITHSRNFGSQAAFRSGMELSSKEACVLLDGDLQDPPELLEEFVKKWREGADVVYGRRVRREMPRALEWCYRMFYRVFDAMSEIPMPRDAGDFSLLDRAATYWLLRCAERDSFLRGLRSYVGFTQVGVDYVRPERLFGRSTNNWIKNIGWAKKAVFAFSRLPLHLLTAFGGITFAASTLLAIVTLGARLLAPDSMPRGITTMLLVSLFFGSATILGLGIIGEYIGKIMEETKARPPFIRKAIITHGLVRDALSRRGGHRHD
jgi:dolichol-phosphate mannosyltransferase